MMKQYLRVIAIVLGGYFSATSASATEVKMHVVSPPVTGAPFTLVVSLDPGADVLNAIEGTIMIPEERILVTRIAHGDSLVPLWIRPPEQSASGSIRFAGVIPGGYTGGPASLFTLSLLPRQEGPATIVVTGSRAFLQDPPGTSVTVSGTPLTFSIAAPSDQEPHRIVAAPDDTPPESFMPDIIRDPRLFEGQWSAIFRAVDKDSGVAGYYAQERLTQNPDPAVWVPATSPYLLLDQDRRHYLFFKAVDTAGNERVVRIDPATPPHSLSWWAWSIMAVCAGAAILWALRYRARRAGSS